MSNWIKAALFLFAFLNHSSTSVVFLHCIKALSPSDRALLMSDVMRSSIFLDTLPISVLAGLINLVEGLERKSLFVVFQCYECFLS